MLFFLSPQYCCFRSSEFNNTLLYQNEGGGNTVTRTSTSLSFKFVVETIRHYYCMLEKSFIWLTRVWFHRMFRSKQGEMLLKFGILHLRYVTHYWARIFYVTHYWALRNMGKWSWNFWKTVFLIQSGCSIYSHFMKPLHWNIHELWHKVLIVMKITARL